MIHVNGRSMVVMESVTERMRLKDKIVANVAKAVKSIQELQMLAGSGTVTLGNQDWQCHRLCEHLDHSLLHGLRHVTPGYWNLVCEFTHKDCIKEIKRMRNVTTDLGRGRAWLFTALNENLLECYLNCFHQNEAMVEEYYVRDALVRDQDRFNVLLTLTSGLENTSFDLERDEPYLDLCVHPPNSKRMANVEATVDFDRLSVCSMESVHLPSNTKHLPQTVFESQDSHIPQYQPAEVDTMSTGSTGSRHSPSVDSGVHSDLNFRQRSITPVDQHATEENADTTTAELEVIHVSKKGKTHKHKKRKKRFVSVSSIIDSDQPEAEEVTDGPVIEIPPLDDFKLLSAIQSSKPATSVQDRQLPMGERHPGDGIESPEKKPAPARVISPEPESARDRGRAASRVDNEIVHVNGADTDPATNTSPNRDSGIFTDMIKAKVNELVEAGDHIHASPGHSDAEHEESSDGNHGNVQYSAGDSETREFLSNAKIYPSYIYDDKTDGEKEEVTEEIADIGEEPETPVEVAEESSIYATRHESDSSSDSDVGFDYEPPPLKPESGDCQPGSRPGSARSRSDDRSSKTPSRASITLPVSRSGTPVCNDIKRRQSSASVKSVENVHTKQNRSDSRHTPDHTSTYDSETEHKNISQRNTPDFMAARSSRPGSAVSRASTNEMSGNEETANQFAGNPLFAGYRDSPVESADDDGASRKSRSSNNATPESAAEIAASETALQAKVEELIEQRSLNTYTHLTFGEEEDEEEWKKEEEEEKAAAAKTSGRSESAVSLRAGEVELDNNSMLMVMLDIVQGDDTFIRMFCCRQGHTEGKTRVVFVLITTESLYLLEQQASRKRFTKLADIPFTDIDFVSLGFNSQILAIACKSSRTSPIVCSMFQLGYNSQILAIACKSSRTSHWLTTGDERVTIALVDCLADSMEKSDSHPARLEVDTGNTIQRISLTKYIASECPCDTEEAEVVCYSLVHWEDPSSSSGSCEWDREGPLYYKSVETASILGTQSWRLASAVLKDCMLCLYNDKTDPKPSHFLSMSGGQCVGCKRDFNADKHHAIRIMMEDGSFWTIALESDDEANRWLQGLCQAVSEGLKMNTVRPSCVPSCMVLSQQKVLMCHEDLETNFLRTLGSANLCDVSGVMRDDDLTNLYMILVFDSADSYVSNEKWVLYFNSEHECHRFQTCLSQCWANHYQVDVPVLLMDDFALQKKCREMASYLKDSLSLR